MSKEDKPKRAKKGEYSSKISKDDLENLEKGVVSVGEVAQKTGVPPTAVSNIKQLHSKKLKIKTQVNRADQNIQDRTIENNVSTNFQATATAVDPTIAVNGLWQGVDTLFFMMAKLSRGTMEYERCSKEDIDKVTVATAGDESIQKLASMGGISTIVKVGVIVGVFVPKFKYHKPIKHNEEDPYCKCKECKKSAEVKQEIVKVIPDKVLENVKEDLSKDGGDGSVKLEKNTVSLKSEAEVIAQNTGKMP